MVSTVTAFTDMVPSPRVNVDIDDADLHVDADTITVWQQSKAGQYRVRNMINRSSVGGFFETDYEVPLGVPVTYRVEQFNSAGTSLGFGALTLETQVDVASNVAVLQDPLAPANAVMVRAESRFASELKRSRPTRVLRAGFESFALMGQYGLLEELNLHCWTEDETNRDLLALVLAETQLLVRTMPKFPIPRVVHVVVPDVIRTPFDYHQGGTTDVWDLVGTEVSRAEIDIIVPTYTWQTVIDYHASLVPPGDWADLIAARSSWLEVRRDPFPEP